MSLQQRTLPPRRPRGGTLVGIFVGVVLGILIAAGVVWFTKKTPLPFMSKVQPAPLTDRGDQPPLNLPDKPGDPIIAAPTSALPTTADADAPPATANQEGAPAARKQYIQVGSFTQAQDADKMKASLAMMGMEVSVQQIMLQNRTHYRLRIGPFSKQEELDRVRAELAQTGITTLVIRE